MRDIRKESVRNSYDALGGRLYEIRYLEEQSEKIEAIKANMCFDDGDLVLDDGCGTGLLFERLKTQVVGVDISQQLLITARSHLGGRPSVHLLYADVEQLPLKSLVFDKVFAVTLIQNTSDPKRALKEMVRVSRDGSEIVVTALKRAFPLRAFEHLISSSGLTMKSAIQDQKLKDWIAFSTRNPESF